MRGAIALRHTMFHAYRMHECRCVASHLGHHGHGMTSVNVHHSTVVEDKRVRRCPARTVARLGRGARPKGRRQTHPGAALVSGLREICGGDELGL